MALTVLPFWTVRQPSSKRTDTKNGDDALQFSHVSVCAMDEMRQGKPSRVKFMDSVTYFVCRSANNEDALLSIHETGGRLLHINLPHIIFRLVLRTVRTHSGRRAWFTSEYTYSIYFVQN